jgi:hypothetical protein
MGAVTSISAMRSLPAPQPAEQEEQAEGTASVCLTLPPNHLTLLAIPVSNPG